MIEMKGRPREEGDEKRSPKRCMSAMKSPKESRASVSFCSVRHCFLSVRMYVRQKGVFAVFEILYCKESLRLHIIK
jgi:hypothetical protein